MRELCITSAVSLKNILKLNILAAFIFKALGFLPDSFVSEQILFRVKR